MEVNREYLHNAYNATSTDDGHGDIETYEAWLERQLIARIKKIEKLLPLAHERLPDKCIHRYHDVKFCPAIQGEGNQCKHCSSYKYPLV